jgi:hypothetical protein
MIISLQTHFVALIIMYFLKTLLAMLLWAFCRVQLIFLRASDFHRPFPFIAFFDEQENCEAKVDALRRDLTINR